MLQKTIKLKSFVPQKKGRVTAVNMDVTLLESAFCL